MHRRRRAKKTIKSLLEDLKENNLVCVCVRKSVCVCERIKLVSLLKYKINSFIYLSICYSLPYVFVKEHNTKYFSMKARFFQCVTASCIITKSLPFVTNQTVWKSGKNSGGYDYCSWGYTFLSRNKCRGAPWGPIQDGGRAVRQLQ